MEPVIGVVEWPCLDEYGNKVYTTPMAIINWILRLNGAPRGIYPSRPEQFLDKRISELKEVTPDELRQLREWVLGCDAIIKPGCNRIYPHDNLIYDIATENDIPYLGICGGMQIMRNHKIPFVSNIKNETNINHFLQGGEYAHSVNIVNGSKLQSILEKDTIMVNSKHSYHVPDEGLKHVGAYAGDGIIEALEDNDRTFNIGVQWHPELLPDDPNSVRIFGAFMDSARQYQKEKHKRVF